MNGAIEIIRKNAEETARLRQEFLRANDEKIAQAALNTACSLARGGKLLICGNGGSAGDAQHVAGEFVNRFLIDRPALPAISLVTDSSVISAIGNDSDFRLIFARQIEALGNNGDILLAISTSGKSANVLEAMKSAREKNLFIIGICGEYGFAEKLADLEICVPSAKTPYIQEMHLVFEHLFCQLTDYFLFQNPETLAKILKEQD